jgi:pimeloyl-ACP methyl ester carboxylesterase
MKKICLILIIFLTIVVLSEQRFFISHSDTAISSQLESQSTSQMLSYDGNTNQFTGGFTPRNAPYGGFGGGNCSCSKTPVIFIHGNGDEARNWDFPASTGVSSVYEEFKSAGYNDCELFGLNYLSNSERAAPNLNYHKPSKAAMIRDFINDVKAYTGKSQVDIIGHSLGVTMAIHGIDYGNLWSSVRKFVGISGAMRGLSSCSWAGPANPYATTCGSQNLFSADIFGFFPHLSSAYNPKMGDGGYRDKPSGKSTTFYTIRAGYQDQIACSTTSYYSGCGDTSKFDSYANVRAQLNVGRGSTAAQLDYNFTDWSIYNLGGGDADGVGHFRAKNNTGIIQVNIIKTNCVGTDCCANYGYSCN